MGTLGIPLQELKIGHPSISIFIRGQQCCHSHFYIEVRDIRGPSKIYKAL